MGKLVKGIRNNLLNNKKNSFNIGFSNRSPFSYQLPSADPNSGVTPIDPPDMDDGTVEMIQAQGKAAADATRAFGKLASSAITEAKKQYSDKDIAEEKLERQQKRVDKKKRRNIASGDPDKKRKDVTQQEIDNFDVSKQSKSKQKRYGKLQDKIDTLDKDIKAGEYSDVSGADLEKAADEKKLAVDQYEAADAKTALANYKKNKKACEDQGKKYDGTGCV